MSVTFDPFTFAPLDVEFYYSGHMTPRKPILFNHSILHSHHRLTLWLLLLSTEFVPWAAFQTIAYVLGKRDSPSA